MLFVRLSFALLSAVVWAFCVNSLFLYIGLSLLMCEWCLFWDAFCLRSLHNRKLSVKFAE